jgi:hypothetical protein
MRSSEDGVAQVIEFTSSISILVIVFTVFFTAVGFQAGQYNDIPPRPTGKAIDATNYLMSNTGYISDLNTPHWERETVTPDDLDNLASFGLSTGEYGIIDYDKAVRLGEFEWGHENYTSFYDTVRVFLGLSYFNPETNIRSNIYNVNITIGYEDGTRLTEWGYPSPQDPSGDNRGEFIGQQHTVITRVILIEEEGTRTPGFLTIDLIR